MRCSVGDEVMKIASIRVPPIWDGLKVTSSGDAPRAVRHDHQPGGFEPASQTPEFYVEKILTQLGRPLLQAEPDERIGEVREKVVTLRIADRGKRSTAQPS